MSVIASRDGDPNGLGIQWELNSPSSIVHKISMLKKRQLCSVTFVTLDKRTDVQQAIDIRGAYAKRRGAIPSREEERANEHHQVWTLGIGPRFGEPHQQTVTCR